MTPDELAKADAEGLRAEVARLHAKHKELHARAQAAERALADLQRCNDKLASGDAWCGGSLGRAFLAWANSQLRAENAELRAALTPLVRLLRHIPHARDGEELMEALSVSYEVHDDEPTVADLRHAAELLKEKKP